MITSADLLTLAKNLIGNTEATNRAAISRAYYASFHAIKNLSERKINYFPPISKDKKSPHWHLCEFLLNHQNQEVKLIGCELRKLSRTRKKADYRLKSTISKSDSSLNVAMASTLIESCKEAFKKNEIETLEG